MEKRTKFLAVFFAATMAISGYFLLTEDRFYTHEELVNLPADELLALFIDNGLLSPYGYKIINPPEFEEDFKENFVIYISGNDKIIRSDPTIMWWAEEIEMIYNKLTGVDLCADPIPEDELYTNDALKEMPAEELLDLFLENGLIIPDYYIENYNEQEFIRFFKRQSSLLFYGAGIPSLGPDYYLLGKRTSDIYDRITGTVECPDIQEVF